MVSLVSVMLYNCGNRSLIWIIANLVVRGSSFYTILLLKNILKLLQVGCKLKIFDLQSLNDTNERRIYISHTQRVEYFSHHYSNDYEN